MNFLVKLKALVMASSLLIATPVLSAATPVQQLEQLMSDFSNYSAQFEQFTRDEQGRVGEVSKGTMSVLRPNKFYWETLTPFPQLIVSDGQYIWIYDEDLEQATRKQVKENETNGAALILNGNVAALNKKFTISQLLDSNGEKLFELLPKTEGNFEKIQLFFVGKTLRELMLVDILGKQTSIILSEAKLNQKFSANLFSFTPPEGTDVMLDDNGN